MLGVVRESGDLEESSPPIPKSALVIKPDPCGSCGVSLAARAGLGDGAFDEGAVAAPFSFLALGSCCSFAGFESISIASSF